MGVEFLGLCSDGGLFAHDDEFGGCGVGGEEAPVHVPPVAEVRVIRVFGSPFEDFENEVLALCGTLDEEFNGGCEKGELNFDAFFGEGEQEVVEEDVGVVDSVGILANYPDHGAFCLGFVERVEVLA